MSVSPGADCVCVDVETSGTDPEQHAIVSVGIAVVRDGRIAHEWESRVQLFPGAVVDEQAMQVHGIPVEALEDAPTWPEAFATLREHAGDLPPVAHNAAFDQGFVAAALRRCGRDEDPWCTEEWTDTLALSRERFPQAGRHNLDALARRVGQEARVAGSAHEAGGDAALLAKVWLALGREADAARQGSLFDDSTPAQTGNDTPIPIREWLTNPDRVRARDDWLRTLGIEP